MSPVKSVNHVPGQDLMQVARWEGFEPPTAWFVARNSIQLSYQREVAYYDLTSSRKPSMVRLPAQPGLAQLQTKKSPQKRGLKGRADTQIIWGE